MDAFSFLGLHSNHLNIIPPLCVFQLFSSSFQTRKCHEVSLTLASVVVLCRSEDADLPVGTVTDFSVCSTRHSAEMIVHVKFFPLTYDVTLTPEHLTKKIYRSNKKTNTQIRPSAEF